MDKKGKWFFSSSYTNRASYYKNISEIGTTPERLMWAQYMTRIYFQLPIY